MRQTLIRRLLATLFILTSLTAMSQVHVYQGAYAYSTEILYTWDGKHLYRGAYAYSTEILYTMDGAVPVPILVVGLQL